MKNPASDRTLGVLFGLAYGDALGRPTEFMQTAALKKFGDPFVKRVGLNTPQQGIVTDDTQMALYLGRAASHVQRIEPGPLMADRFVAAFISWRKDPKSFDGRRAPGATCTSAADSLVRNPRQWLLATRPDSKGNGANMRVAPLALRTDWTWEQLGGAAQLQAAITHGHPTALAAAELTAVAVRVLLEGFGHPTESLIDHLLAYAYDQREKYRGDWIGHLWQATDHHPVSYPKKDTGWTADVWERKNWWDDAAGLLPAASVKPKPKPRRAARTPQKYIQRGWDEMIDALLAIYGAVRDPQQDPCKVGGQGWVAEEALATSLHTLLCFPGDPTNALRRAAFTNGDSDSIGAITGALAGAAYGRQAFPSHWIGNLEYRAELESLAAALAR